MQILAVAVLIFGAVLAQNVDGAPDGEPPPPPWVSRSTLERLDREAPPQNSTIPGCTTRDNVMVSRNGMRDKKYRWKDFNVYLDPAFDDNERNRITQVLYDLSQHIPCVRFGLWPRDGTPGGDYVHVIKGSDNGCNSWVGRLGGRQDMNLQSPACSTHYGSIAHEMLHALGFHHEHGRPDRDDFVNIHRENIISGYEFAFDKYSNNEVTTFGVPYNYKSVMHYPGNAFSKNRRATITAKNGERLGSDQVQETDIRKLKLMYEC
jgi:hypothetical protein